MPSNYYKTHLAEVIRRSARWAELHPERVRQIKLESWRRRYHAKARPGRQPKRATTPCKECGQPVSAPPAARRRGRGKFCSLKCLRAATVQRPNRICARCGAPFFAKRQQLNKGQGRYCSLKCRAILNPEKKKASVRRAHDKRRARLAGTTHEPVDYQRIARRDRMRCHLCHRKVALANLHFDHVIPLSKGGTHTEANMAVSHARCNLRKHAKRTTLF